jgi:hypothetical protein
VRQQYFSSHHAQGLHSVGAMEKHASSCLRHAWKCRWAVSYGADLHGARKPLAETDVPPAVGQTAGIMRVLRARPWGCPIGGPFPAYVVRQYS